MSNVIFKGVVSCSRCGHDHPELEFKPLVGRPMVDSDGVVWTHWTICPETGDPIMARKLDPADPQTLEPEQA